MRTRLFAIASALLLAQGTCLGETDDNPESLIEARGIEATLQAVQYEIGMSGWSPVLREIEVAVRLMVRKCYDTLDQISDEEGADTQAVLGDFTDHLRFLAELRSAWYASRSVEGVALAAHIDVELYALLHGFMRNRPDKLQMLPPELQTFEEGLRLESYELFEYFDQALRESRKDFQPLSEICKTSAPGRPKCWDEYFSQLGLKYFAFSEHDRSYLMLLPASIEPMIAQEAMPHPVFMVFGGLLLIETTDSVLRSESPGVYAHYLSKVSDHCRQSSITLRALKASQDPNQSKNLDEVMQELEDELGPDGERWLWYEDPRGMSHYWGRVLGLAHRLRQQAHREIQESEDRQHEMLRLYFPSD